MIAAHVTGLSLVHVVEISSLSRVPHVMDEIRSNTLSLLGSYLGPSRFAPLPKACAPLTRLCSHLGSTKSGGSSQLSSHPATRPLVLLAQPPSSRLHAGVWRVVCLAVVCALDHVRRAACAIALAGVLSVPPSASDTSVPSMINRAIARFWDLLTEFFVLNAAPGSWQHSVVASHPFFAWNNSWVVLRALP